MPEIMTYASLVRDIQTWTERNDSTFVAAIPSFISAAEAQLARELKTLGFRRSVTGSFTTGTQTLAKPSRWRASISFNYGTRLSYSTQARLSVAGARTLYLTEEPDLEVGQEVVVSGLGSATYNATATLTAVSGNTISYSTGSLTESITTDTAGTVVTDRQRRNTLYLRSYEQLRQFWPDPTLRAAPRYYADYDFSNFLIAPTPDAAYPWELTYYEQVIPLDSTNTSNWLTQYAPDLMRFSVLLQTAPYLKDDGRIQVWRQSYDRILQTEYGQDVVRRTDAASRTGQGGLNT